jgi:3-hydroxy-3-methylglutaryl CoA synthase/uncharacterized OB-fold protein
MAGSAAITAIASYVPPARLAVRDVRRAWPGAGAPAGVRSVAVAGFDEDVVTMAVEAVDALFAAAGVAGDDVDAVVLATCSSPYAEHSAAAEVARALDLPRSVALVDLAGSVRGGVVGLVRAADGVASGRWRRVVVVATDARRGEPGTPVEAQGAGAVAALVASTGGAVLGAATTWRHGVPTRWRPDGSRALRSYDDARYERDEMVVPAVRGALASLGGRAFTFAAGGHTDARSPSVIAQATGLGETGNGGSGTAPIDLGADELAELGALGTAGPLLALAHCLSRVEAGAEGVCFAVEPGAGADAVALTVAAPQVRGGVEEGVVSMVHRRPGPVEVDYVGFLRRHGVLEAAAMAPIVPWAATPGAQRDDLVGALVGAECGDCGSVSIPPRPVCLDCGSRTSTPRPVPRRGVVVTHNRQHVVAVHPEPAPVSVGVARLDGLGGERGGQVSAMFCDSDLDAVRVGSPVELVYRRLGADDGLVKYGWKLRLVTDGESS